MDIKSDETNVKNEAQNENEDYDDDDDEDNSIGAKNTDNRLTKTAMTESYSEILNSHFDDIREANIDHGIPMEIPKRKSSSVSRHCEFKSI